MIPRAVDEYLQLLAAYPRQDAKSKLDNAVWHVHAGNPPSGDVPLTFALFDQYREMRFAAKPLRAYVLSGAPAPSPASAAGIGGVP